MTNPLESRWAPVSPGLFSHVTDEEYAAAFRTAGWGESAIAIELDRLHAFREGREFERVPTTREVLQQRFQPAPPPPEPAPEPAPEHNLAAALVRSRKRRGDTPEQEAPP